LRQAGANVEVHDNHFPQDAIDEEWLKAAGEEGWIVLTKDNNIRYHTRETQTLMAYDVKAFILTGKALNADEMAQAFVDALSKIARILAKHRGPFVATVTRSGAVKVVLPNLQKTQ
jgi:hypothetical protein